MRKENHKRLRLSAAEVPDRASTEVLKEKKLRINNVASFQASAAASDMFTIKLYFIIIYIILRTSQYQISQTNTTKSGAGRT